MTAKSNAPNYYTIEVLQHMVDDLNRNQTTQRFKYELKQDQRGFRLIRVDYINTGILEILSHSTKRELGLQLKAYMLGLETSI